MTPNEIGLILDHEERAKAAQEWLADQERAAEKVREIRDHAIVGMRVEGRTQRYCARTLHMSNGRIAQIDAENGVETVQVATLGMRGPQHGR